jgi:hypothetical protein
MVMGSRVHDWKIFMLIVFSFLSLFAWLISHQPAVLFSHNKSATSNQPAVLFSQNKPAPAISHQPTELAPCHEACEISFKKMKPVK